MGTKVYVNPVQSLGTMRCIRRCKSEAKLWGKVAKLSSGRREATLMRPQSEVTSHRVGSLNLSNKCDWRGREK